MGSLYGSTRSYIVLRISSTSVSLIDHARDVVDIVYTPAGSWRRCLLGWIGLEGAHNGLLSLASGAASAITAVLACIWGFVVSLMC